MKNLRRDLMLARTVSRRQLWARARKKGRRLLYPVRVRLHNACARTPEPRQLFRPEAAGAIEERGGLVSYLRDVIRPRWFPAPDVAELEPSVFPETSETCMTAANGVVSGTYRFLNVAAELGHPPGWTSSPAGGREWTYLLNRFHYLLDLGRAYRYTRNELYCRVGMELVENWIETNPTGHPVTWESVSCSWRIENWLAAALHFAPSNLMSERWLGRVLVSVAQHAEYVRRHIEYDLAGNHLLFEAKGLIVCGVLLPELRGSATWLQEGMALLRREAARQVLPDGGHGELATHYHVEITLLLTEVALLLTINQVDVPPELRATLKRMFRFLQWVTKPDGHIPMLGDSVRDDPIEAGVLLGLGALLLEETGLGQLRRGGAQVDRLLGAGASARLQDVHTPERHGASQTFPSSGYAVARSGWDAGADYLIWDCGPFGMRAGPGHGHADALSFELAIGGESVIIDPGVYQYEAGPWRDYFRGVTAHNTLAADERQPCHMWGAYRVANPPRVRLLGWMNDEGVVSGEAEHDGYSRGGAGVLHRRSLSWLDHTVWVIVDWLYPATHRLEWCAYLHLAPGARVTCAPPAFAVVLAGGTAVEGCVLGAYDSMDIAEGERDPPQGWVSYAFGEKVAAPVLRIRGTGTRKPLVTLLSRQGELGVWESAWGDAGAGVLKGAVDGKKVWFGLRGPTSSLLRHGPLETDARTALIQWDAGTIARAVLVDGRFMLWKGEPLLQTRSTADIVSWERKGRVGVITASPGAVVRVGIEGATVPAGDGGGTRPDGWFYFPLRRGHP